MENEIVNTIANKVTEGAAKGFFERVFELYNSFIIIFPVQYQWVVSAIIFLAVAGFMWNLIKRNWLWLILLVVVFPGILPVLQNIFNSLSQMFIGK
ncbi:hypothetical protein KJ836_02550 [Patescibacteria group bacterium]|nr:hypothetical protein [Patescibacteria group bacterium]